MLCPFWFWNGKLNPTELVDQLKKIHDNGITQVIPQPREGIEEYRTPKYFDTFAQVTSVAKSEGMKFVIYDDFNWPSGSAGGKISEKYPAMTIRPNLTKTKSRFTLPYSWDNYSDTMDPKAAREFTWLTHERYKQIVGEHFKKTITGFFMDEPGMYANFLGMEKGGMPWTDGLPQRHKELHEGNEFFDDLRKMQGLRTANNMRAGIRVMTTAGKLHTEGILDTVRKWTNSHGLKLYGHLIGEETPLELVKTQGNPYDAIMKFDVPGFDVIGAYDPAKMRLASALPRATGKDYFCEAFGAFGNGLTLETMVQMTKDISETGTNTLVPHALFQSLKGGRKHDSMPEDRKSVV